MFLFKASNKYRERFCVYVHAVLHGNSQYSWVSLGYNTMADGGQIMRFEVDSNEILLYNWPPCALKWNLMKPTNNADAQLIAFQRTAVVFTIVLCCCRRRQHFHCFLLILSWMAKPWQLFHYLYIERVFWSA